jgi:hypothetical protein
VTKTLRRFGLTDEWALGRLFRHHDFPSTREIVSQLRKGSRELPSGLTERYIAGAILQAVAEAEDDPYVIVDGIALRSPTGGAADPAAFDRVIVEMIEWFRQMVEQRGAGTTIAGDEDRAQVVFLAGAEQIAKYNDVDLSREVETGRGPVDFKISRGFARRALVELKRASNSAYWDGLRFQLPTYLLATDIDVGHFITIIESDADERRVADRSAILAAAREKVRYSLHEHVVDARRRPSASKAKSLH